MTKVIVKSKHKSKFKRKTKSKRRAKIAFISDLNQGQAELQKPTGFNPKPKHYIFAECYIISKGNVNKACRKAKMYRSVYYDWSKVPGFSEWLSAYSKDETLKRYGKWYLLAEKFAEKGSYSHLQLLFELAKRYIPQLDIGHKFKDLTNDQVIDIARERGLVLPARLARWIRANRK